MKPADLLRVNEPNVVHETIDGETILLDLNTGNYFSLEGTGAVIWETFVECGDWQEILRLFVSYKNNDTEQITNSITAFFNNLVEEKLLVENSNAEIRSLSADSTERIRQAAQNFEIPVVNKYSDMQDLLLLDPIHEVNEKGWPESKETSDPVE